MNKFDLNCVRQTTSSRTLVPPETLFFFRANLHKVHSFLNTSDQVDIIIPSVHCQLLLKLPTKFLTSRPSREKGAKSWKRRKRSGAQPCGKTCEWKAQMCRARWKVLSITGCRSAWWSFLPKVSSSEPFLGDSHMNTSFAQRLLDFAGTNQRWRVQRWPSAVKWPSRSAILIMFIFLTPFCFTYFISFPSPRVFNLINVARISSNNDWCLCFRKFLKASNVKTVESSWESAFSRLPLGII